MEPVSSYVDVSNIKRIQGKNSWLLWTKKE
jgi:hypothetical protein